MEERKFYSPREVAVILGVCKETILRRVRDGRIPSTRLGLGKNSVIRIPKSWLQESQREVGAT